MAAESLGCEVVPERGAAGQAIVGLRWKAVLEVGTHWKTSFLAVVRNAFRISYGMGMIYDRNFGASTREGENMDSWRFKRW